MENFRGLNSVVLKTYIVIISTSAMRTMNKSLIRHMSIFTHTQDGEE